MKKIENTATNSETIPRESNALLKTEQGPKQLNECQFKSNSDCSKLMALQDALQDPITNCEGF